MKSTGLHITLNGQTFELDQLLSGNDSDLEATEQSVIGFCRQWLTGAKEFVHPTSGSTGRPKEIRVQRTQMQHSARLTRDALKLAPGMTALVCLDTRYIAGQMMLVRCMEIGMHMVVTSATSTPLQEVTQAIDLAAMVPYQVQNTLQSEHAQRINLIKTLIVGGGALNTWTEQRLQSESVRAYATYGMTETVSHIALRAINGSVRSSWFSTLPEIQIEQDVRGCLVIEGPVVSAGPMITNDVVELRSANQFRWLGRADFVINSGGIKVFPEKVENQIDPLMHRYAPGQRFFVYGYPHEVWGQQVTLVVEGTKLPSALEAELTQEFRGCLTRFEVPREFRYCGEFVEAANGKISRVATAALASPSPLSGERSKGSG